MEHRNALGSVGLLKRVKGIQAALEQGMANAGAATGRVMSFDHESTLEQLPPFRYCWPPQA